MSGDTSAFGFGKFIPGFEFLQGLAQSAGAAANPMGRAAQWVAPTVSVEEVEKRIAELKAVQFWLEQNGRALAATIQALEVQRMTLSTLKGMNVSMSELAQSFQFPGAGAAADAAPAQASAKGWPMGEAAARPEPQPQAQAQEPEKEQPAKDEPNAAAALGQAMQWWGSLTQQFQQIAAKALAEPVPQETMAAAQRATEMASGFAKTAMDNVMAQAKPAAKKAAAPAKKTTAAAKKAPAKKAAPARKTTARKA